MFHGQLYITHGWYWCACAGIVLYCEVCVGQPACGNNTHPNMHTHMSHALSIAHGPMAHGPCPMAHCAWHMAHDTWPMTHGPLSMAHGTCPMEHGPLPMAHVPWHIAHDPWHMPHGTWPIANDPCHMTHDTRHMAHGPIATWPMAHAFTLHMTHCQLPDGQWPMVHGP